MATEKHWPEKDRLTLVRGRVARMGEIEAEAALYLAPQLT